jgi:hypothetical protein
MAGWDARRRQLFKIYGVGRESDSASLLKGFYWMVVDVTCVSLKETLTSFLLGQVILKYKLIVD